MKDQFFKFSRLVFITSIALAVLVGLLIAFIALGGHARFHLIKDNGKTIEAEVDGQPDESDSAFIDSTRNAHSKSGF